MQWLRVARSGGGWEEEHILPPSDTGYSMHSIVLGSKHYMDIWWYMIFMPSSNLIVGLDQLLEEIQGVRRRRTSHLQEQCLPDTPGLWGGYIVCNMSRRAHICGPAIIYWVDGLLDHVWWWGEGGSKYLLVEALPHVQGLSWDNMVCIRCWKT